MLPGTKIHDPGAEYWTPEGCFINELANDPEDPDASLALARVRPGDCTRWHHLEGTAERYLILEGTGRVEIGDLPARDLVSYDVALIPPGTRQRITNTGSRDLVFLAVCTPRFRAEAYRDVEQPPPAP